MQTDYYGVLPDTLIRRYALEHDMIVPFLDYTDPRTPNSISYGLSSHGYDIRPTNVFFVFKGSLAGRIIDPKRFDPAIYDRVEVAADDVFYLPPHGFALCHSAETFSMPADVKATCIGKSTYARCGTEVHITPLEAGWRGVLTIEISNQSPLPITIYPYEGIAQLEFTRIPGIERTYADKGGKYQHQTGITLPRMS